MFHGHGHCELLWLAISRSIATEVEQLSFSIDKSDPLIAELYNCSYNNTMMDTIALIYARDCCSDHSTGPREGALIFLNMTL